MKVIIEFFGVQRVITKTDCIRMPISDAMIVRDALEYVRSQFPDLTLEEETLLATVNQEAVPIDQPLKAGDSICFLPGIGGG
jgi:molybdopterin converting factor small subunit